MFYRVLSSCTILAVFVFLWGRWGNTNGRGAQHDTTYRHCPTFLLHEMEKKNTSKNTHKKHPKKHFFFKKKKTTFQKNIPKTQQKPHESSYSFRLLSSFPPPTHAGGAPSAGAWEAVQRPQKSPKENSFGSL